MSDLETTTELKIDWGKLEKVGALGQHVIPVVVQDIDTLTVLIVAFANQQALEETLETGIATFWSTSRNALWVKGATSGDILAVYHVLVNCEQNSLVYQVRSQGKDGGACHVKDVEGKNRDSCYYRKVLLQDGWKLKFLSP